MSTQNPPRIALISGSTRAGSVNQQAVKAVRHVFKDLGAKTSILKLSDYDMPIYNGDFEAAHGVPIAAKKLIRRLKSYDGVFISTPEYNGGLPALLKNTIDWTTRIGTDHFSGPVYAVGACSPGALSGVMALRELHFLLCRLGATVVPAQVGIGNAGSAFDVKGRFFSGRTENRAKAMAEQMIAEIKRRR